MKAHKLYDAEKHKFFISKNAYIQWIGISTLSQLVFELATGWSLSNFVLPMSFAMFEINPDCLILSEKMPNEAVSNEKSPRSQGEEMSTKTVPYQAQNDASHETNLPLNDNTNNNKSHY